MPQGSTKGDQVRNIPIDAQPLIDFPGPPGRVMPEVPHAEPTFDVFPDRIIDRRDASVRTKDQYGRDLKDSQQIADLIRNELYEFRKDHSRVGVMCHGRLRGVDIGHKGNSQGRRGFWPANTPVSGIDFIGSDASKPATIESSSFGDNRGGWDDVYFRGIAFTVEHGGFSQNLTVFQGSNGGRIGLYDVHMASDTTAYGGHGKKRWVRGHGVASWDVRRVTGTGAEEGPFYIDRPGAYDGRPSLFDFQMDDGFVAGAWPMQLDSRTKKTFNGFPLYPGPPSAAPLYLTNIKVNVDRQRGKGGSGITLAGHGGPVVVDACEIGGNTGMFTAWTDIPKGSHLHRDGEYIGDYDQTNWADEFGDPKGWSHTQVWVRGMKFGGNDTGLPSDRPAFMLSGCEMAAIMACDASGHDKPFLHLHPSGGGPIGNRFAFVNRRLVHDGDVVLIGS